MDILHVCPAFFPFRGGVETHVLEVSKRLSDLGINVRVFTTDPSGVLPKKEKIGKFEIFRFKSFSPNERDGFISPTLYYALRKLRDIDLIHTHSYPAFPAVAAALAKSKNEKPICFTPHYGGYKAHTLGTSIFRTLAKRLYNQSVGKYLFVTADVIITVGKFEGEVLKEKFSVDEDKVMCIPNGVKTRELQNPGMKEGEVKTILYVGRIEKYKGIHFLIEAYREVRNFFPDVQLIIVGKGPYKRELVSLTQNYGLQDSVRFLEDVSETRLAELYSSSNIFVTLSQFEAQPIALIEAMSYGVPVIATRVGGIPEVIDHNKTGCLMDFPPDRHVLVDLIVSFLEDTEYSSKIGLKAKNVARSRFSWDRTVESLVRVYEQLS